MARRTTRRSSCTRRCARADARPSDGRRLRPRSRSAGRPAVRGGGARAARAVRAARARSARQDVRREGPAGLRAARRGRRRPTSDTKPFAHRSRAARAALPELVVSRMAKRLRAGEGARRLEPERPAQDDRRRLLASVRASGRRSRRRWLGRSCAPRTPPARRRQLVFDPAAVLERVAEHGDPFAPLLSVRQQLPAL